MLWGFCHGTLGPPRAFAGGTLLGRQTLRALGSPAGGTDSFKTRFSPNAADGDIYIFGVATSSGYRFQPRQDGTYYYDANSDGSRQLVTADLYDLTFSARAGEGSLAINDQAPKATGPGGTLFGGGTLPKSQAISQQVSASDPQGDTITFAVHAGTFPPGLSLSSSGLATGSPSTYGSFGFTVRMTDPYGAFADSVESLRIATIFPNFVVPPQLLSGAQATLAALGLSESHSSVGSALAANTIVSQSIPPGTVITSAVSVTFVTSNGSGFTAATNVFPSDIAGLNWDGTRTVEFVGSYQESITGKPTTLVYTKYPTIHWELVYELINQQVVADEFKKLAGFFNSNLGQQSTFLYLDPVFNTVAAEPFGTGDGVTTQFQLVAKYGNSGGPSITEIIQQLQAAPAIQDNGTTVLTSAYMVNSTGLVTFNVAPITGHALTWSGSFYYLCRFELDDLTPENFMNKWWSLNSLKFQSVII